jgi:uncharacterized protein
LSGPLPREMGALEGELHIFAYEGRDILYHAETGAFFEIDSLVKDAVMCAGVNARRDDVICELSDRYPLDQVVGVLEELEAADILAFSPTALIEGPEQADRDSGAPQPITMCLHVAHACNLTCTYCFAHGGDYGGKAQLMDWSTGRQAVDWLMDLSQDAGSCRIEFFGGEPMLNFGLIRRVVRYARRVASEREMGVSFGITTNGTILEPQMMSFIITEDIGVLVSLDGNRSTQDTHRAFLNGTETFDCVTQNARKLSAERPDLLQARATMTPVDLNIAGIAESLAATGAASVSVSPVNVSPHHPNAIRAEHLPEIKHRLRELSRIELSEALHGGALKAGYFGKRVRQVVGAERKEYGCGGGKTYFGVAVDGGIYFCSAFASMADFRMGHVATGIRPEAADRFDREFHVESKEPCNTCWARHLCGGGCAYDAQVACGDVSSPNPVSCEQILLSYELAMGMALELREQTPDLFHSLATTDD